MTLTTREAAAMLRAADPVRDTQAGLDGRAESDLRRIFASRDADAAEGTQPRRPRARLLTAAAPAVAGSRTRRLPTGLSSWRPHDFSYLGTLGIIPIDNGRDEMVLKSSPKEGLHAFTTTDMQGRSSASSRTLARGWGRAWR